MQNVSFSTSQPTRCAVLPDFPTETLRECHQRIVSLLEHREDRVLFLHGNADARVADHEVHHQVRARERLRNRFDGHFSPRGELDRVIHRVRQHLAEATVVADDSTRRVRMDMPGELQAAFSSSGSRSFRSKAAKTVAATAPP